MRALVVCVSVSHGNTRKVAEAMGGELGADVIEPEQVRPDETAGYDLLGIGSGIYAMTFHPRLWRFAGSLPRGDGKPVFLFATSGSQELWWRPAAAAMRALLWSKGYRVVGTFAGPGWDTWLPLRLVGGINRGRPGDADLAAARSFASGLSGQAPAAQGPAHPSRETRARPVRRRRAAGHLSST